LGLKDIALGQELKVEFLAAPSLREIHGQALIGGARERQRQIKIGHALGQGRPFHPSRYELVEEALLYMGQAFRQLAPYAFLVLPRQAFLVEQGLKSREGRLELAGGNGLDHVVEHLQLQRLLRVFEVVIARYDDYLGGGGHRRQALAQGKAVHEGHIYIRHEHVGGTALGGFQGLAAVGVGAREAETELFPGYGVPYAVAYFRLVVDQDEAIKAVLHPGDCNPEKPGGERKSRENAG
jgi:hypothetical protein